MEHLPKNAKKVFEGIRSDIYHWQQELFDGNKAIFEKIHRLPTVTIIAVVEGQIVVQNEEQPGKAPFIAVPGGIRDRGEEALAAAQRELLEETGLVSDDWVEWKNLGSRGYLHWENHFFIARNCRKVADQKLDAGEKISGRRAALDEFLKLADDDTFRNRDLSIHMYRMRLDPKLKEQFKNLLKI